MASSEFLGFSSSTLLLAALTSLIGYVSVLYVYRIYFSPLSHIPGPKLAAATRWYEFYYDAIKTGHFYREVEQMHRVYGPIVRITPYEVHINDPAFFNELYNVTKKLDKDPWYYQWLDRNGSIFATIDSDIHKRRAGVIKKAFSTSSVAKIEPVLKKHFGTYCRLLETSRADKKQLNLSDVYRSLAVDVITDLSLPESMNLLETPDLGAAHSAFIRDMTEFSLWNRHFPWITPLLLKIPRWLIGLQGETALNVIDSLEEQKEQARKVIANGGKSVSSKTYPVIMNEVYKSPDLPPQDKSVKRLEDEIGILIGAGSETTGHTLATITYHVLSNPDVHQKLKDELRSSFTNEDLEDVLSYKKLEHLPYLNACIQEGLRLASSVCGRLPRINKVQPTTYTSSITSQSYHIPAGTPMSMSIRDIHYNVSIYPSPWDFKPERWLGEQKVLSERGFAAFNRGSRSCVGKNLAMAELQMAIGNLFGRFDVTKEEGLGRADVELEHDCFSPFTVRASKGVVVNVV
ncbi:cytochrome P450 [Lophiotrema nucula]|uniref:Cytochrome P450 n=1 Tax=Lophiotrema nucula TaxID=690887 RepID=A0A6A5YQL9_9PLEO|nr:cytochrome P450 [Lophiotrema nucula]